VYLDAENKSLLINKQLGGFSKQEEELRKRAYESIEILRSYVEKFRVNHALTCALLNQCACELTSA